jgi:hypothetical protein
LTSSAIRKQTLFTPSKKVLFTPILNEDSSIKINGIQHLPNSISSKEVNNAKVNIVEKLTSKSPLRETKKIKFLEKNPDMNVDADKIVKSPANKSSVIKDVKKVVSKANSSKPINATKQITIPKEFNFSKRLDKPLRVKNYPTRKSQGIQV